MIKTEQKAPVITEAPRRWEPLSDEMMDLIQERIIKLKTLRQMGDIYLKYQRECLDEYDVDLDVLSLWLDIFKETVTEINLILT